ncbi:alpha/beta-hydrolase [Auriscalpium vulgare]|uniref:Alpha/beta-hydrolase n=1 Tax=Auriscalpium vulgare TaxID=40419 RepID=A0ACB8S986_9AGAM|nr:alpha/beta-hydrolase [Auriscalpium vulgare]
MLRCRRFRSLRHAKTTYHSGPRNDGPRTRPVTVAALQPEPHRVTPTRRTSNLSAERSPQAWLHWTRRGAAGSLAVGGLFGGVGLQPSGDPPSVALVLSVILGLPAALWVYKCLVMYVFQRKIIYMGYAPLGSREETLADVRSSIPTAVSCDEVALRSPTGDVLSGLLLRTELGKPRNVIVYLQGNAGSPLHRIPVFTTLLSAIPSLAIIAIAPRSYWTSTPTRPTQDGIIADYTCILKHAASLYPDATLTVYGHSLGGAAAACVLAQLPAADLPSLRGLILENPFASIPGMVRALYPQRWLPYHYMGPLVWDKWDACLAVETAEEGSALRALISDILVLVSEKDEVVPTVMGKELFARSQGIGRAVGSRRLVVVRSALHEDAWRQREWRQEMKSYFLKLGS